MEFKSCLHFELEGNGEVVDYAHGLAVVTAGVPFGHLLNNSQGLGVESGVFAANDVDVGD